MTNLVIFFNIYVMIFLKPYNIFESNSTKLGDVCEVKLNFQGADFWLQRNGTEKNVGTPSKVFSKDNIGIKVIATDILDANYLFYYLQYLHTKHYFYKLAAYTTPLCHIRIVDIKNILLNFK